MPTRLSDTDPVRRGRIVLEDLDAVADLASTAAMPYPQGDSYCSIVGSIAGAPETDAEINPTIEFGPSNTTPPFATDVNNPFTSVAGGSVFAINTPNTVWIPSASPVQFVQAANLVPLQNTSQPPTEALRIYGLPVGTDGQVIIICNDRFPQSSFTDVYDNDSVMVFGTGPIQLVQGDPNRFVYAPYALSDDPTGTLFYQFMIQDALATNSGSAPGHTIYAGGFAILMYSVAKQAWRFVAGSSTRDADVWNRGEITLRPQYLGTGAKYADAFGMPNLTNGNVNNGNKPAIPVDGVFIDCDDTYISSPPVQLPVSLNAFRVNTIGASPPSLGALAASNAYFSGQVMALGYSVYTPYVPAVVSPPSPAVPAAIIPGFTGIIPPGCNIHVQGGIITGYTPTGFTGFILFQYITSIISAGPPPLYTLSTITITIVNGLITGYTIV